MNVVHASNRLRRPIHEVFEENEWMIHIIGVTGMNAVHALNRLRRPIHEVFEENEWMIHYYEE